MTNDNKNKNIVNIDYTTIDYDALRQELISYLKDTDTFKDVDFESSNINTLIGLYSWLGSMFGYYTNSIANEPFLPSAKRYKNLNRISKLLSYNPIGYRSATLDVIGSLSPEYCFGKEDTYFEIPAYSIFPSNKNTPNGDEFSFTNPTNFIYMTKGFGIRKVEGSDFSYSGFTLPYTANKDFWDDGTGSYVFDASNIELNLSDTLPLSILNRIQPSNLKPFDSDNVPLFDPNDIDSIGQPFVRNLTMKTTTLRIESEKNYYIVFTYDTEQSKPFLEILEEGAILNERQDDIISVIRLVPEDANGDFWTLKEVQNNSAGKFYLGILGMKNLSSTQFNFDKLDSTENGIKQIHLDINQSGSEPPFQLLVNGEIYTFTSGRISSQVLTINTWDVNQPYYNVNLTIVSPDQPTFNYDAKLNVTSKDPTVNEVTISRIYPSVTDTDTGISTISRQSGQRFGNIQAIPESNVVTNEQKSGFVTFSEGVTSMFVSFDVPFTVDSGNLEYSISLTPSENVQLWFNSKSESGFLINVEENSGFEGIVNWVATKLDPEESRELEIVFDEDIPQIDGSDADYTIFLTASDNINVWYEDKTSSGFKIKSEKSFNGEVSYSTFVFSDNQDVLNEVTSSTQRKGSITLSGDNTTRDITFDGEFPNTDYGLHMITNKNVNVWYTNKTTTGFTINVESTDGNIIVDWYADYSEEYKYQKHGTISFVGQTTNAGTIPGLRYNNIPETFLINELKQGSVKFSYINSNGVIDNANNGLLLSMAADRRSAKEIKFQVGQDNVSYSDLRLFVKNTSGVWEEWENASDESASTDISVGEKVYFVRVEDTKKIEIKFGDGVNFGKDPYGSEIILFGLFTVGKDGNIPVNSLSNSVILSKEILGDDNITINFEKQFIQLVGLKTNLFFESSDSITDPTVIYDSEGTTINSSILSISQSTPAYGGSFPETTEELRSNALTSNIRQDRIVSLDDYVSYLKTAFNEIILDAKALSYKEILDSGFVSRSDLENNYFFNYIFLIVLTKTGNELTKTQKDLILNNLNKNFKSMATVQHEIFSANNVHIDTRIRFKPNKLGSATSIETNIRRVIRDFFKPENRTMGETIHHSDIIDLILDNVSGIDYIEVAMHKDVNNSLTKTDYDTDGIAETTEDVVDVKRKKILELLAKDPSIMTIVDPLFDVKNNETNERKWEFTFNIYLNKYEFPTVGDIIIELDPGE